MVLALEGVANPENVGALLRSALALGGCAALLAPGCADPLYRKAVRASMGAAFALPYARATEDWPADLSRLNPSIYSPPAPAARRSPRRQPRRCRRRRRRRSHRS